MGDIIGKITDSLMQVMENNTVTVNSQQQDQGQSAQNTESAYNKKRILTEESANVSKHAKVDGLHFSNVSDSCCDHIVINNLPSTIIVNIFGYLSVDDLLLGAMLVCKRWNLLAKDPELWRVIDLTGKNKVTDDVLDRLCQYSCNVSTLILPNLRHVTVNGVTRTLQKCCSVKHLSLAGAVDLDQSAYLAIGANCHKLVTANLECCYNMNDVALGRMGKYCQLLEQVRLSQCNFITDAGVELLAEGCPRLKSLMLKHCTQVTDSAVKVICAECQDMEELSLMRCDITCQSYHYISQLTKLQTLEITSISGVTPSDIECIVKSSRQLQCLSLSLCQVIDDTCVETIVQHSKCLTSLYLVSCNITNLSLKLIGEHLKNMEKLDVGWCQGVTDEGVENLLCSLPKLTYLGLMRCDNVTDETSKALSEQYPNCTISTMWLDCHRLIDKARQEGHIQFVNGKVQLVKQLHPS